MNSRNEISFLVTNQAEVWKDKDVKYFKNNESHSINSLISRIPKEDVRSNRRSFEVTVSTLESLVDSLDKRSEEIERLREPSESISINFVDDVEDLATKDDEIESKKSTEAPKEELRCEKYVNKTLAQIVDDAILAHSEIEPKSSNYEDSFIENTKLFEMSDRNGPLKERGAQEIGMENLALFQASDNKRFDLKKSSVNKSDSSVSASWRTVLNFDLLDDNSTVISDFSENDYGNKIIHHLTQSELDISCVSYYSSSQSSICTNKSSFDFITSGLRTKSGQEIEKDKIETKEDLEPSISGEQKEQQLKCRRSVETCSKVDCKPDFDSNQHTWEASLTETQRSTKTFIGPEVQMIELLNYKKGAQIIPTNLDDLRNQEEREKLQEIEFNVKMYPKEEPEKIQQIPCNVETYLKVGPTSTLEAASVNSNQHTLETSLPEIQKRMNTFSGLKLSLIEPSNYQKSVQLISTSLEHLIDKELEKLQQIESDAKVGSKSDLEVTGVNYKQHTLEAALPVSKKSTPNKPELQMTQLLINQKDAHIIPTSLEQLIDQLIDQREPEKLQQTECNRETNLKVVPTSGFEVSDVYYKQNILEASLPELQNSTNSLNKQELQMSESLINQKDVRIILSNLEQLIDQEKPEKLQQTECNSETHLKVVSTSGFEVSDLNYMQRTLEAISTRIEHLMDLDEPEKLHQLKWSVKTYPKIVSPPNFDGLNSNQHTQLKTQFPKNQKSSSMLNEPELEIVKSPINRKGAQIITTSVEHLNDMEKPEEQIECIIETSSKVDSTSIFNAPLLKIKENADELDKLEAQLTRPLIQKDAQIILNSLEQLLDQEEPEKIQQIECHRETLLKVDSTSGFEVVDVNYKQHALEASLPEPQKGTNTLNESVLQKVTEPLINQKDLQTISASLEQVIDQDEPEKLHQVKWSVKKYPKTVASPNFDVVGLNSNKHTLKTQLPKNQKRSNMLKKPELEIAEAPIYQKDAQIIPTSLEKVMGQNGPEKLHQVKWSVKKYPKIVASPNFQVVGFNSNQHTLKTQLPKNQKSSNMLNEPELEIAETPTNKKDAQIILSSLEQLIDQEEPEKIRQLECNRETLLKVDLTSEFEVTDLNYKQNILEASLPEPQKSTNTLNKPELQMTEPNQEDLQSISTSLEHLVDQDEPEKLHQVKWSAKTYSKIISPPNFDLAGLNLNQHNLKTEFPKSEKSSNMLNKPELEVSESPISQKDAQIIPTRLEHLKDLEKPEEQTECIVEAYSKVDFTSIFDVVGVNSNQHILEASFLEGKENAEKLDKLEAHLIGPPINQEGVETRLEPLININQSTESKLLTKSTPLMEYLAGCGNNNSDSFGSQLKHVVETLKIVNKNVLNELKYINKNVLDSLEKVNSNVTFTLETIKSSNFCKIDPKTVVSDNFNNCKELIKFCSSASRFRELGSSRSGSLSMNSLSSALRGPEIFKSVIYGVEDCKSKLQESEGDSLELTMKTSSNELKATSTTSPLGVKQFYSNGLKAICGVVKSNPVKLDPPVDKNIYMEIIVQDEKMENDTPEEEQSFELEWEEMFEVDEIELTDINSFDYPHPADCSCYNCKYTSNSNLLTSNSVLSHSKIHSGSMDNVFLSKDPELEKETSTLKESIAGAVRSQKKVHKKASFMFKLSNLKLNISSIEDKCKQRDEIISETTERLKLTANNIYFEAFRQLRSSENENKVKVPTVNSELHLSDKKIDQRSSFSTLLNSCIASEEVKNFFELCKELYNEKKKEKLRRDAEVSNSAVEPKQKKIFRLPLNANKRAELKAKFLNWLTELNIKSESKSDVAINSKSDSKEKGKSKNDNSRLNVEKGDEIRGSWENKHFSTPLINFGKSDGIKKKPREVALNSKSCSFNERLRPKQSGGFNNDGLIPIIYLENTPSNLKQKWNYENNSLKFPSLSQLKDPNKKVPKPQFSSNLRVYQSITVNIREKKQTKACKSNTPKRPKDELYEIVNLRGEKVRLIKSLTGSTFSSKNRSYLQSLIDCYNGVAINNCLEAQKKKEYSSRLRNLMYKKDSTGSEEKSDYAPYRRNTTSPSNKFKSGKKACLPKPVKLGTNNITPMKSPFTLKESKIRTPARKESPTLESKITIAHKDHPRRKNISLNLNYVYSRDENFFKSTTTADSSDTSVIPRKRAKSENRKLFKNSPIRFKDMKNMPFSYV